ncbi:MAG TPA: M28 family peptidase, partial [Terriglobales bacterium]|nr:M28 family peptidase [Terriglobales bacterium]
MAGASVAAQSARSQGGSVSKAAVIAAVMLACLCSACSNKQEQTASAATIAPAQPASQPQPANTNAAVPGPADAKVQIDPARAMRYTKEIVGFGPRSIDTAAHAKLQEYLLAHLRTDAKDVETDDFTAQTPAGEFKMRNIIAKFPGKRDGVIAIGSHYDTLYGRKDFVGANDGGSSTALLLELADQLHAQKERPGYSVWLIFFDGEEAVKQWTNTDSTYGSRHLAEKWQAGGTAKKIRAFLLADMIGDADLDIQRDQNSTPWLEDLVYGAATN